MKIDINDLRCTLCSLEKVALPEKIYTSCIATAPETRLYAIGTAQCSLMQVLMSPVGLLCQTQKKYIDAVIEKTRIVFARFLEDINHPETAPSDLTKSMCVLMHEPKWKERLVHAYKILQCPEKFPLASVVERISSSFILESVTATTIPWEILERVLRTVKVTYEDMLELTPWAKELETHTAKISTKLFLGIFRQVSYRLYPQKSERKRTEDAFTLALLLNEKFDVLFAPDHVFEDKVLCKILSKVEAAPEKISITLSKRVHVQAYPLAKKDTCSVLVSSQPMVLGIIDQYILQKRNTFPTLTIRERDDDGEYLIVDRIIGTLETVNCSGSKNIVDSLVDIVKKALPLASTPEFILEKFVVTCEFKICLLDQLPVKHRFFSICEIEQFVRKACKHNDVLITHVLRESGFFLSPYAAIFSVILKSVKDIGLKISSEHIQERLILGNVTDDLTLRCEIEKWLLTLSTHVKKTVKTLKKDIPVQKIIDAIIALQKELGFLSVVPDNLHEEIVRKIKEQEEVVEKAPSLIHAKQILPVLSSDETSYLSRTVKRISERVSIGLTRIVTSV